MVLVKKKYLNMYELFCWENSFGLFTPNGISCSSSVFLSRYSMIKAVLVKEAMLKDKFCFGEKLQVCLNEPLCNINYVGLKRLAVSTTTRE